jgi:hypothetical protein
MRQYQMIARKKGALHLDLVSFWGNDVPPIQC